MGKRKVSKEEELEICRRYELGESAAEIAPAYNMDPSGIRLVLKRNKVELRTIKEANRLAKSKIQKVYSDEQKEFVCQKYLEGYSYKQIFEMLGCGSRTSVQAVIESRGLKRPRKKSKIFNHHQLAEICARYSAGDSAPIIAADFGTSTSVICKLLESHGVDRRDASEASGALKEREQDRVCALYLEGFTPREISAEIGCSESYVKVILVRRSVPRRSHIEAAGGLPVPLRIEAISGYKEGLSITELSVKYGTTASTMSRIIRSSGIEIRTLSEALSGIHKASYPEIVARYLAGSSAYKLAQDYCVTSATISSILKSEGVKTRTFLQSRLALELSDYPIIAKRYESGEASTSLAEEYGVSHGTITRILKVSGVEIRDAGGDSMQDAIDGAQRFFGRRETAFYIYSLREFKGYRKLGIAFDLDVRRKRAGGHYGQEVYVQWFSTRREAFFFEQAVLKHTKSDWDCPEQLIDQGWAGVSEVRLTSSTDLLQLASFLNDELQELGAWCFAAVHCPLTAPQREKCFQNSEHDVPIEPPDELPSFDEGEEVAGCTYLGSKRRNDKFGDLIWLLQCGECGTTFERRASEHWYAAKKGEKKLCSKRQLHVGGKDGIKYAQRLSELGRLEALEPYQGRRVKLLHRCLIHDQTGYTTPESALQGCGLRECCQSEMLSRSLRKDTQYFIDKSVSIHGNEYDYSLVEYLDKDRPVEIVCPKHGAFWQSPSQHYIGKGCVMCTYERFSEDYTEDLTGRRFGKVTVLGRSDPTHSQASRGTYWLVRCACGSEPYVIHQSSLKQRNYRVSCSRCSRYASWRELEPAPLGQTFSRLTLLREWGRNRYGQRKVLCECVCGRSTVQILHQVTSGRIQGCGCMQSGDSIERFISDPERANQDCYVYLANVDGKYIKPGISTDPVHRARVSDGRYLNYHFVSHRLTRCEAWAIEQRLLRETIDAYPQDLNDEYLEWGGVTELRDPLYYDVAWYRTRLYELIDNLAACGWYDLL